MKKKSAYHVYILKCCDGSLYTGIALDLARRIGEHNSSVKGARYTKARRPVELVYSRECADRGTALKEELRIKGLGRDEKLKLIYN